MPEDFRFVLKAPQRITHHKRLKDVDDDVSYFQRVALGLKQRLGPLLFQLPPNFKKDVERLSALLDLIDGTQAAIEFRDASWFDDEIFDRLRKKSCGLCVADGEDLPSTDLVNTADWGYLRLRGEIYTDADLDSWLKKIKAQSWKDVYVFFKHEDAGTGPKFATRFLELAGT